MEITKEEFERYVKVQNSGRTNMFLISVVSSLARLDKDKVFAIMQQYDVLSDKYLKEKA